jgi:hypothetical protein
MIRLASLLYESAPRLQYSLANGLKIDANNGVGAVSDNSNIAYMGFVIWIRPSEFLKLNPPRQDNIPSTAIEKKPIAPPFLIAEWKEGYWQVKQHEGRGRCKFIIQQYGDDPIPVQVFPRNMRARHVTPEMLSASFKGDGTGATVRPSKTEHNPQGR